MEAFEEHPVHIPSFEGVKEGTAEATDTIAPDIIEDCHKSNGLSQSASEVGQGCVEHSAIAANEPINDCAAASEPENTNQPTSQTVEFMEMHDSGVVEEVTHQEEVCQTNEVALFETCSDMTGPKLMEVSEIETEVITDNQFEIPSENLVLQTEVSVEKEELPEEENGNNENDNENKTESHLDDQSIYLSEALRTSDNTTENTENNNMSMKEEVLNNEELLDILEGNDLDTTTESNNSLKVPLHKEAEMALQQLSRLRGRTPSKNKKNNLIKLISEPKGKITKSKTNKKKLDKKLSETIAGEIAVNTPETTDIKTKNVKKNVEKKLLEGNENSEVILDENVQPTEENIVNALVKDWDDDEHDANKTKELLDETNNLLKASESLIEEQKQNDDKTNVDTKTRDSLDSSQEDQSNPNKSSDEGHTQRRGRIIKKKVIFDPDNPDTFTKGKEKTAIKSKEAAVDKEVQQLVAKKSTKVEPVTPRATSKSPVSKSPWKKPTPKNSKQHKRLSEVDRLLMDEGAVNMMYQLTPEAQKGKKNIRTKAEFIKKINQSSTPDGKEMKFRERKKEKLEEGEAKKILVGKQRPSATGSVTSASLCEDFDSRPDDSIIYRRHSSSSYSSTCMSPRRLSDVESGAVQQAIAQANLATPSENSGSPNVSTENGLQQGDVFMATIPGSPEIINKKVCMSLKEKLNSKLSTVLNKRKRESKTDKPIKQKKLTLKNEDSQVVGEINFKTVSLSFDGKIAEICIRKTGSENNEYGTEALEEIEKALRLVDGRKDTFVTLLTSEDGTFCSRLNLTPLLEPNMETRTNYAFDITESVRSVLIAMEQHSKVLIGGVSGACEGLALAMLVLCDLAYASEDASFTLSASSTAPLMPGVAVLTSSSRLSQALVRDLVLTGRRLSAPEAASRGLLARALWPPRFTEELRATAAHVAEQGHTLLIKKQLLKATSAPESSFQSRLAAEQDTVAAYWTSVEGQDTLQAHLNK
ncbi:general transcriptional corepressor trfA [Plutella xylostella]|uniref:general transcriptional corepressor trfA n=1 Tax=Plutella xylostella TaxID=51655 RepID=UPI0020330DBD|nr:general transcriptional corepressor trfA [Plutella xylostella]